MKTLNKLIIISAFFAVSCASTNNAGQAYDDIYYNPSDDNKVVENSEKPGNPYSENIEEPQTKSSQAYTDDNGDTYISNNYYNEDDFNYDDYYDYEYATRIRRFHSPVVVSDCYYDSYYTNSYWYNYDPYYYGTSVYMGYNWWPSYGYYGGYYGSGWGVSIGYGGYYGGYPYYGGYYGGGSYWAGYNHGYNNGYYDGRYGNSTSYYYNSYDRTNYGRNSSGSYNSFVNN